MHTYKTMPHVLVLSFALYAAHVTRTGAEPYVTPETLSWFIGFVVRLTYLRAISVTRKYIVSEH